MQGFSPNSIWVVKEDEMGGACGTYSAFHFYNEILIQFEHDTICKKEHKM